MGERVIEGDVQSMKTVLMVAEHFPPSFAVGGKRPYRFARYLPDSGWRPVLWTGPAPDPSRADTTDHPLPEVAVLERTLLPSWWPESKGRPSDGTTAAATRERSASASPLDALGRQLQIPLGAKRLLRAWMLGRALDLVKRYEPDAIFATSSPYYLLDLGARIKAKTGLPLCLDLRDPWSLNFLQGHKPAWLRSVESKIESRSFHAADRVLLTCETAAEAYRQKYQRLPAGRFQTVYNSFDPELSPAPAPRSWQDGPVDLIHFGNCYGPRRLKTVIQAIDGLRRAGAVGAHRLRLVNLGRPAQADLDLIEELELGPLLHWEPYVPYAAGLERLAQAPLQLLLAYGEETLYVPAKTFDYMLSGAPILCLSESSELCSMVTDSDSGFAAKPNDVPEVMRVLERVLTAASQNTRACEPNPDTIAKYSSRSTAAQLATILDQITGGAP
jgi:hypothetical protein